jgi:hypothetical protein
MDTNEEMEAKKESVVGVESGDAVVNEKNDFAQAKFRRRVLMCAFVLIMTATALALAFYLKNQLCNQVPRYAVLQSFEIPLDEIAAEMIAGFNEFSFAITNGEQVVHVGNFLAKRVSAVGERVRFNFDATTYKVESGERWETSVLIELSLVGDGTRLKGDNITLRRIHIYDLPKIIGNDELEYDSRVVSLVKDRFRPSKEVVSDWQKVIDVKLTTDDNVNVIWENIK